MNVHQKTVEAAVAQQDLDLAVVGNGRTVALVNPLARIVWWCFPRYDGDPVFCRLISGNEEKGFADVVLDGLVSAQSAYLRNTAIIETVLTDKDGAAVRITDFAPRFEQFGRTFRPPQLMRIIERLKPKGLVHEVAWDLSRENSWRIKFEEAKTNIENTNAEINESMANLGYAVTRSEVITHLKGRADFWRGPVEFYAAYQSKADFEQLHPAEDALKDGVERVNFLVQHRLAVPDDRPDRMLDRVIGLVTNEKFRDRRREFYDFQIDLFGTTKNPS